MGLDLIIKLVFMHFFVLLIKIFGNIALRLSKNDILQNVIFRNESFRISKILNIGKSLIYIYNCNNEKF